MPGISGIFFVADGDGFVQGDRLYSFNCVIAAVRTLAQTDLAFQISMLAAVGNTVVVAGAMRKPVKLFGCIFTTFGT